MRKFTVYENVDDAFMRNDFWLLENAVRRGYMTLVAGGGDTSINVLMDMSVCVANGYEAWRGMRIDEKTPVLFIDGEKDYSYIYCVHAKLLERNRIEDACVTLAYAGDDGFAGRSQELWQEIGEEIERNKYGLVVFNNLAALSGYDGSQYRNTLQEMYRFTDYGVAVVVIHDASPEDLSDYEWHFPDTVLGYRGRNLVTLASKTGKKINCQIEGLSNLLGYTSAMTEGDDDDKEMEW